MIRAAGILILSRDNKVLFLKRGPGGDSPGMWCFPGGRIEDGEDPITAAVRETSEEAGVDVPAGKLQLWTRRVGPRITTGAPVTPNSAPAALSLNAEMLRKSMQDSLAVPALVPGEEVDFTTYLLRGSDEFIPKLGPEGSPEHVAYAWAPIDQPPQPIHPGAMTALAKLDPNADELTIAQLMAAGELTSPQKWHHIWLFNMRITGTGVAFRRKHDEFVFRDPSLYLNDHFLKRCAGLPAILEHPKGNILNTQEYHDRNVGSVLLPYIRGTEVWGVTKIIDAPAAKMMEENQLSTSPAVVWRDTSVNDTVTLESGEVFLVEGKPSLLDHLAICKQGVWDKDGEPVGIETQASRGDDVMKVNIKRIEGETDDGYAARVAEAQKLVDTARADSVATVDNRDLLAAVRAATESMNTAMTRMDSIEEDMKADRKGRKDAEEEGEKEKRADARRRADAFKFSGRKDDDDDDSFKSRHDAEEKDCADAEMEAGEPKEMAADKAKKRRHDAEEEDMKARKDAEEKDGHRGDSRADAVTVETLKTLTTELAELREQIKKGRIVRSDSEIDQFVAVQSRADSVAQGFGKSASRPLDGESLLGYRRRLLRDFQKHDQSWSKVDLNVVAVSDEALTIAENHIYASAASAAMSPASVGPGELREVHGKTDAGHKMIKFVGEPLSWMGRFAPTGRAITNIDTKKGR